VFSVSHPRIAYDHRAAIEPPANRLLVLLAFAFVLLPIAVTLAALVGREWYPTSDQALAMLQIGDVGGAGHTVDGRVVAVGLGSPGTTAVLALAPFTWLFGHVGMLVGMVVINGATMTVALVVAGRRGGWPLTTLVSLMLLALCTAQGPGQLLDPWNPRAAVLPFLTFVLLAWALADGDFSLHLSWWVSAHSYCRLTSATPY
jgi:hypothetical protein